MDLMKELWNCRNELCLRCGSYRESHLGACDGCRYNAENMKKIQITAGIEQITGVNNENL